MAEPHGSITVPSPPDLNDPLTGITSAAPASDAVIIAVDSPKDATGVTVRLFESDEDVKGQDDLLATFTVDVSATGDARVTAGPTFPAQGSKAKQGTIEVRISGSDARTFKVPILHDPGEAEGLELTFGLEVAHGGKTYTSKGKGLGELVRAKATGPTLAVITGEDPPDNPLFAAATAYWKTRADEMPIDALKPAGGVSLEAILELLASADKRASKIPYRFVNIVMHGAGEGIFIRGRKNDASVPKGSLAPGQRTSDLNALRKDLADQTDPLGPLVRIDKAHTRVVIRGCNAGRDPSLLAAFSRLFASCRVYAPKHYLLYSTSGKLEALEEPISFSRPGDVRGLSKADQAKAYAAETSASKTWPEDPDGPFVRMLREGKRDDPTTSIRLWQDEKPSVVTVRADYTFTGKAPAPAELPAFWAKEANRNQEELERWFNSRSAAEWELVIESERPSLLDGKPDPKGGGVVTLRGTKTIFELRRVIAQEPVPTDLKDVKLVVPDLENGDHFGQIGPL